MPLTHRPPPQPVRATHVEEVQRAAQTLVDAAMRYLRRLMWGLEYSRTEYVSGRGGRASAGAVQVRLDSSPSNAGAVVTPATTGSDTPSVNNKRVLVQQMVGTQQPVRTVTRYFDGQLVSTVPAAQTLPPATPQPVEPAPLDMTDLDEDTYDAYIKGWARYVAQMIERLVDQEWRKHWVDVARFRSGIVTSASVPQKTARVRLDSESGTAASVLCGFGTRVWTAAQLHGKRVRVGYTPTLGRWIDDLNS